MNMAPAFVWSFSIILALVIGGAVYGASEQASPAPPQFTAAGNGEFEFNTGFLRGKLRAGGKSMGLSSVIHVPSGKRLDRSNGLFSHYRVFTHNVRYGGGAWDWPSQAKLQDDGSVEVRWAAVEGRPFSMRAVYRWRNPLTLDLETVVQAEKDLGGLESFLASYFSEGFTNAAVYVNNSPDANGMPGFLPARAEFGAWQMFPRDTNVLGLITEGRWKLLPNPVDWKIMPLAQPLSFRRDPAAGLTVVLMSPPSDCFAVAMPHQTEGHYSVYLSLFGRDIKAGETARARARLKFAEKISEEEMVKSYQGYCRELRQ